MIIHYYHDHNHYHHVHNHYYHHHRNHHYHDHSGFKDNLKYGFGGNAMTGGQKQNLIFGGLFLGFLLFMSGYLLE